MSPVVRGCGRRGAPAAPAARTRDLSAEALFAYKLNWQSVLFVGYGDVRQEDTFEELQRAGRRAFLKLSYAFQR